MDCHCRIKNSGKSVLSALSSGGHHWTSPNVQKFTDTRMKESGDPDKAALDEVMRLI
jgi:hypothetical protein